MEEKSAMNAACQNERPYHVSSVCIGVYDSIFDNECHVPQIKPVLEPGALNDKSKEERIQKANISMIERQAHITA